MSAPVSRIRAPHRRRREMWRRMKAVYDRLRSSEDVRECRNLDLALWPPQPASDSHPTNNQAG